eukprot:505153-Hanusia_phi.AAC.1
MPQRTSELPDVLRLIVFSPRQFCLPRRLALCNLFMFLDAALYVQMLNTSSSPALSPISSRSHCSPILPPIRLTSYSLCDQSSAEEEHSITGSLLRSSPFLPVPSAEHIVQEECVPGGPHFDYTYYSTYGGTSASSTCPPFLPFSSHLFYPASLSTLAYTFSSDPFL